MVLIIGIKVLFFHIFYMKNYKNYFFTKKI